METLEEYINQIENMEQRQRMREIVAWVSNKYPKLELKIKWDTPMFTDHDTFIIGFSVTKKHINVAPERVVINTFSDEIERAGYTHTKELIQIPWTSQIDFSFLEQLITYNINEKKGLSSFWRKQDTQSVQSWILNDIMKSIEMLHVKKGISN